MVRMIQKALLFTACLTAAAASTNAGDIENKQVLATSPQALIEMLEAVSFMAPAEYQQTIAAQRAAHMFPLGLEQLPQKLDESTDPRRGIRSEDLQAYADVLAGIALESRRDGELLWGRIQGTQYERKAHRWIAQKLQSFGLDNVHYDKFPSLYPQWRPTTCELVVTGAPGFAPEQTHDFDLAITAFVSANTPKAGITAEMIYVGDATPAELRGRDLNGKIVLLRGRTQPSAIMNSARTAYSRLAEGSYGMPAGVVVWWDVPGVEQVAGRVGAPGGGDSVGLAVPWTTIGNNDGLYLRKLLDRASDQAPVMVRLNVQGHMESGEQRMSGNVYAMLPGQSGDYIVIPTHVDGYFYGIHDNGASVALNLALAKHYAQIPLAERQHGIIFLFQGDHEIPGVGGTLPFIDRHRKLMQENLLLVLRPEHLGMIRPLDEGVFVGSSNVTDPLMLLVTNRSPVLIDIFKQAIHHYAIPTGDFVYVDPAADEAAFHPPFNDLGAISSGWIQTGKFYHSTADVDVAGVNYKQLEKLARAHAYIIDQLSAVTQADLKRGGFPVPEKSIYQSELIKMMMGNN